MKLIASFALCLLGFPLFGSITMSRIDPKLVISNPSIQFDSISLKDEVKLKNAVQFLFEEMLLDHIGSKAYDSKAKFETYFQVFGSNYRLIDLNNDGIPELIFNGFIDIDQENEMLEIYSMKSGVWTETFKGKGNLLAYKIHPNTNEVLLFLHQYPCCNNGSHNLDRLRLIKGKIQVVKKFFIGRDQGMVGPFFPSSTVFEKKYKTLKKNTVLRWSPSKVESNAWSGRTPENIITIYPKGTKYKVLGASKKWLFVLMKGAPEEGPNVVINPLNFKETWIFGWIKT